MSESATQGGRNEDAVNPFAIKSILVVLLKKW